MKQATGEYVKVKAITKTQAIKMAKRIFDNSNGISELMAEGNKLWAAGDRLMAAGDRLMAEGDRLMAEGRKLMAEGDRLMAEIAIELKGYIPDYRSMNFIAQDLPDHVYCFVLTHKEIWIYDGVDRPDRDSVEKVDWK